MTRITTLILLLSAVAASQQGGTAPENPEVKPIKPIEKIDNGVVRAPREDEAELRKRVNALVTRLGSATFQDREDAYTELEKLGRAAIPHLERHAEHRDAETRVRIRALLEGLRKAPPALDLPPEENDGFEDLQPRRPGGIRIRPLEPGAGEFGDLSDLWQQMDRLFERRGLGLGGRPDDLMQRHRDMMDRLERDLDAMSQGGMTLRIGPGGGTSFSSSTSLTHGDERLTWSTTSDGVRLDIRGPAGESSFTAKDLDAFMTDHADVYERYKASGIFERTTFNITVPGLQPNDPGSFGRPGVRGSGRLFEDLERLLGGALGGRLGDPFGRTQRPPVDQARPRLGVVVTRLPADVAANHDTEAVGADGLWVVEVTPGSVAADLGLVSGDVIVGFGDRPMNTPADLRGAVQEAGPGASIRVSVLREGKIESLAGRLPGEPRRTTTPEGSTEQEPVRKITPHPRRTPKRTKKL